MNDMNQPIWVLAAGHAGVAGLIEQARSLGGPVVALVVGPAALGERLAASDVDEVVWLHTGDDVPAEAVAAQVADLADEAQPGLVLGSAQPADRVLLAAAATAVGAPVLTGVGALRATEDGIEAERLLFGGIAEETVVARGPLAVVLDGGATPAPAGAPAPVREVPATARGVELLDEQPPEDARVDLGAARRVVAIGRGLKAREDITVIDALAAAAKAEVACSRPLAEGVDWFPKDRYVGVSGQHLSPDLYVAIGISGQLQHMSGVRGAHTIVAINSDAEAPVFADADYGLVGDLYELVPALTAALAQDGSV